MNYSGGGKKWLLASDYYRLADEELNVAAGIETLSKDIPLTRQKQVEVMLVISGEADMMINGVHYKVSQGSFIYLSPHYYYQINVVSPIKYYSARWSLGLKLVYSVQKSTANLLSEILQEGDNVVELIDGNADTIEAIFNNMIKEFSADRHAREVMLIHQAMMLCAYFFRFSTDLNKKKLYLTRPAEWQFITDLAIDIQGQNLEELAKRNQVTLPEMDKFLERETGYGLKKTRTLNQIIFASAMLHFGDLSISYIARLLDSKSVANFIRAFKTYHGISPDEFRKTCTHSGKTKQATGKDIAIKALIFLIKNHHQAHLCPAVVAAEFNVTESSLNDIMIRNFDHSIYDLMLLLRLHYAKILLKETDIHISTLAAKCGFESVSTLNRNFKKKHEISPAQYRKQDFSKEAMV